MYKGGGVSRWRYAENGALKVQFAVLGYWCTDLDEDILKN